MTDVEHPETKTKGRVFAREKVGRVYVGDLGRLIREMGDEDIQAAWDSGANLGLLINSDAKTPERIKEFLLLIKSCCVFNKQGWGCYVSAWGVDDEADFDKKLDYALPPPENITNELGCDPEKFDEFLVDKIEYQIVLPRKPEAKAEIYSKEDLRKNRKDIRMNRMEAGEMSAYYILKLEEKMPWGETVEKTVVLIDDARIKVYEDQGKAVSTGNLKILKDEDAGWIKNLAKDPDAATQEAKIDLEKRMLAPICANCKDVRVKLSDGEETWIQIEAAIKSFKGVLCENVDFTHSICGDCAKKLYPEFYDEIKD
jgi:hypothetical protein